MTREIRAIHTASTVRVYQAYNAKIAESAAAANSFRAPLEEGSWSAERMTWIKPSKVWMAYRCGWTVLKGKNQSRVLALDLDRQYFEELLLNNAVVTGHHDSSTCAQPKNKNKCRESDIVVQWDPERYMSLEKEGWRGKKNQVHTTSKGAAVRSIQIGLRGKAVEALLDDDFVLRITDVTESFRNALKALQGGDMQRAEEMLWPEEESGKEQLMEVTEELRKALEM